MEQKVLNIYTPEGALKQYKSKRKWAWSIETLPGYYMIFLIPLVMSIIILIVYPILPINNKDYSIAPARLELLSHELMSKEYLLTLDTSINSILLTLLISLAILTLAILLFLQKNYFSFLFLALSFLLSAIAFDFPAQLDKRDINTSVKTLYSSEFYNDSRLVIDNNDLKLLLEVEEIEDNKIKIKTTFANKDEALYYKAYSEYKELKPTLANPYVELDKESKND